MPSDILSEKIRLKDILLFKDLSSRELKTLKTHLREKIYRKGDMLSLEGDECDRILILVSGRLKVFRSAPTGRELIIETLGPGDTCACNPGSEAWTCTSSVQALTPVRVWLFSRNYYLKLLKTNNKLAHTLNQLFAERLCRFKNTIEGISLDDPPRRLAKFFLDMLGDQESTGQDNECLRVSLTHEEISQRLGLVRETVTRHLQKLKKQGLIDVRSHQIIVLDKQGLEKILLN